MLKKGSTIFVVEVNSANDDRRLDAYYDVEEIPEDNEEWPVFVCTVLEKAHFIVEKTIEGVK